MRHVFQYYQRYKIDITKKGCWLLDAQVGNYEMVPRIGRSLFKLNVCSNTPMHFITVKANGFGDGYKMINPFSTKTFSTGTSGSSRDAFLLVIDWANQSIEMFVAENAKSRIMQIYADALLGDLDGEIERFRSMT